MITSFDHYECNGCGYMYHVEEIHSGRLDCEYPCPRCGLPIACTTFIKAREEVEKEVMNG